MSIFEELRLLLIEIPNRDEILYKIADAINRSQYDTTVVLHAQQILGEISDV